MSALPLEVSPTGHTTVTKDSEGLSFSLSLFSSLTQNPCYLPPTPPRILSRQSRADSWLVSRTIPLRTRTRTRTRTHTHTPPPHMSQFLPELEKKKRRHTVSLSLFGALNASFSIDVPAKSSTSFENGAGVGLGIVAAMNSDNCSETARVPNLLLPPRSNPISIASLGKPAANFKGGIGFPNLERIVDESDESYTCVISRVGNDVIEKRVYYGFDNSIRTYDARPGLFYTSSSPTTVTMMSIGVGCGGSVEREEFWTSNFLSSCYLCNRPLHGLDIFMYRGEKAFCSVECREKQIRSEDYKEKCGSESRRAHEYSESPCSSRHVFLAGVAAA